jgi:beta-mannanase
VRGALPVITWMSAPTDYTRRGDLSDYSLASIAAGYHDEYLRAWAARIAVQQLPVVIRFDHESNGSWYPWSVGWHRQGITGNTPADYRAAWRHVWDIFQTMGANAFTIWAYVPTRIDTLGTYGSGYPSQRALVTASYPGDRYVDWVGVDGYQYDPAESSTYHQTFAASFDTLSSFTNRPILVAEMGAAEDGAGIKPRWIKQTYAGLAADPRVIGACYFDNDVTGVHYINGAPVHTNWKVTSSPAALAAVRAGVADGAFGAGIYPPYLLGD